MSTAVETAFEEGAAELRARIKAWEDRIRLPGESDASLWARLVGLTMQLSPQQRFAARMRALRAPKEG